MDASVVESLQISPPPEPHPEAKLSSRPRKASLKLGTADEVPELRRRPFICGYYRLEPPQMKQFWCCHNELGNMWTHVVAAILIAMRLRMWISTQQHSHIWVMPALFYRFGVLLYFIAGFVTFCISVVYHYRMSSTDDVFMKWMCIDQSACLALVVLGFFSGVPMGFHCFSTLQFFYITTSLSVCLLMALALTLIPKSRWDIIAAVLICGTVIGAVTPAVHWLIISEQGRNSAGTKMTTMLILTPLAAVFYTTYVPECFAPGKFDLIGNSHQWWHIGTFISISLYGEVLVRVLELIDAQSFCT